MIEFKNITYANSIALNITEVGVADSEAVLCRTDCCTGQGHWRYPNGTHIGNRTSRYGIFSSRGNMTVGLHKMTDVMSPTGQYCCEVATTTNTDASICIILSKA